jgi:hypothetical protein
MNFRRNTFIVSSVTWPSSGVTAAIFDDGYGSAMDLASSNAVPSDKNSPLAVYGVCLAPYRFRRNPTSITDGLRNVGTRRFIVRRTHSVQLARMTRQYRGAN